MEPTTKTPAPLLTPDEMSLKQRVMADAPPFWKVVGLIAGALMMAAGACLTYHLCNPIIPATVGTVASVAWALHNFAAKYPITSDTFTPAGMMAYFNQAMQVAQQSWAKGFNPGDAPSAAVEFTTLKDLEDKQQTEATPDNSIPGYVPPDAIQ